MTLWLVGGWLLANLVALGLAAAAGRAERWSERQRLAERFAAGR